MADPKLVELLKQGWRVWNQWREQQPWDVQIDLRNADLNNIDLSSTHMRITEIASIDLHSVRDVDLGGADLHNVDLSGADLSSADLNDVNLNGAHLNDAHLIGTHLSNADLRGAHLSNTDLRGAHLRDANLSNADLNGANLNSADLCGADLSYARLEKAKWTHATIGWTLFGDVDLRCVIGLETVIHEGPSTIGLDTIYRSHGQIPEVFLRGAGVPETFIANMRALVDSMSPIDYYTCFISYSHQNEDFANRLYADLQAKGVRCWFAPEDMKIGDKIRRRIDESIRIYDKLLLVLSEYSVISDWVEHEVEAALAKERRNHHTVLFPVRLDDSILEYEHDGWPALVQHERHIGNFTCWKDHDSYQQAFERLLRDLKAETKGMSNG